MSKAERNAKVLDLKKKAIWLKHKAHNAYCQKDRALAEFHECRLDIVQTAIQQLCHV